MSNSESITIDEAAKLLAPYIYPNDTKRERIDKMRKVILHAAQAKKNQLPRNADGTFLRNDFFYWARTKWSTRLLNAQNIPTVARPKTGQMRVEGREGDAYSLPGDPNEVKRLYGEERKQRRKFERHANEVQTQLDIQLVEKNKLSAKRAAAGRKGGKGRSVENI